MKTTAEIKSLMLERKDFLEAKISRLEDELSEDSTELAELTLLIETGRLDWEQESKPQGWLRPEKGSIWESGEICYEVLESKDYGVDLKPLNGGNEAIYLRYEEFYESFKPVAWPLPGDVWKAKNDSATSYVIDEVKGKIVFFKDADRDRIYSMSIQGFLEELELAS